MRTLTPPQMDVRADRAELRAASVAGLTATPKEIPPAWFYDDVGCALVDAITRSDGYYPTRREREILYSEAGAVARLTEADTLVALGAGSSETALLLLDALGARGTLRRFVPFDASEPAVRRLADLVAGGYRGLEVRGVVGDLGCDLAAVPLGGRRLVAVPAGTIGRMGPPARTGFLARVAGCLSADEHLLLGADLVKDGARLEAAYDDPAGVTAAFNLNVLSVLNRELGADFDHRRFEHVARFDEANEWTELLLRSRSDQIVWVAGLGLAVPFREGEEVRTGIRATYRRDTLAVELEVAGLEPVRFWTDSRGDCALVLARPSF